MNKKNFKRQNFDPQNVPVVGSLGILALGDVGFDAWRKAKIKASRKKDNEKE